MVQFQLLLSPWAYPRGFVVFSFLMAVYSPLPAGHAQAGHAERDNSPLPGLAIKNKYVVFCTK